jgi:Putative prokaryotic signal transducing protein
MTAAATDAGVPDRTTSLVTIAHPRDDIEAQLITNLLADAGIEAMVTGGSLAGFRAEAPANVCVVVRAHDADAAREALAEARPTIDESQVGDDSPSDTQAPQGRALDVIFPAVLLLGAVTTLGLLGWWLAGLPGFEASPLDFIVAFGMLALLWLVWQKRRA